MKKIISLLFALAFIYTVSAQSNSTDSENNSRSSLLNGKMDFQLIEQIGLNNWSNSNFVNQGLPESTFTEIRGVYNLNFTSSHFGVFVDMGIGILSSTEMKSLDMNKLPMPNSGTQYYLRETRTELGSSRVSPTIKMTIGTFRNLALTNMLSVTPYLGVGFMTTSQRKYEVVLKEDGKNTQYNATYIWNSGESSDGYPANLFYLNGRIKMSYKLSPKLNLILGAEYTHFLNSMDYYHKFTNSFNANIWKDNTIKGNKVNLLGLSVGIAFM